MKNLFRNLLAAVLLALGGLLPLTAAALPFNSLVIFGDSLSDAGNNAFHFDTVIGPPLPPGTLRTPTPTPPPLAFVPTLPYASNRYSNGPVWVEQLADTLGLSATASRLGGSNYAHGGARTGPAGSPFPFSLVDQFSTYLGSTGGTASPDALYIVAGGGNDARDAFVLAAGGGDPTSLVTGYANNIGLILTQLAARGAEHFLVANVPDIGKLPAVQDLGSFAASVATDVAEGFNAALDMVLGTLPADVRDDVHYLDLFGLTGQLFVDPTSLGFSDATADCAADAACIASPTGTFFWDGIHPTTEGHALIARFAIAAIPEPGTPLLVGLGLIALAMRRRAERE